MSIVQSDALTVSISTPFGINAAFHIITSVYLDDINQVIDFNVSSYVNQTSYLQGLSPLIQGSYSSLSTSDYQSLVSNTQGFIGPLYAYLSTLPPFRQS
jgi:hypothetical protein